MTDQNVDAVPNTTASEPPLTPKQRQMAALTPWKKGQSGNPTGKAINQKTILKNLAQRKTRKAINTLTRLMEDDDQPGSVRVSCATAILAWGHGRPEVQANIKAEINVNASGEIRAILTQIENAGTSAVMNEMTSHNDSNIIDVTPELDEEQGQ